MLFLISGTVTLSSCRKEGCTDKTAKNYNEKAKKDDGTCAFEGSVVFWYDQSVANFLDGDGATTLYFYLDGQLVGSQGALMYWTSAPTCGQNSSITVTKDLGTVKSKTYTYKVIDQTGFEYWSGSLSVDANTCLKQQLN